MCGDVFRVHIPCYCLASDKTPPHLGSPLFCVEARASSEDEKVAFTAQPSINVGQLPGPADGKVFFLCFPLLLTPDCC